MSNVSTASPDRRYLERIDIGNFRTFGEAFTLRLPAEPSITLVYGPNGHGKTTFFDAVEWGLTGKVRRFDDYVSSADARRAEYLTHVHAPPGSHRVSLFFTGTDPIDRSAEAHPDAAAVANVLKSSEWPEVNDLSLYLSLTHFFGQSAAQRFSVKDSKAQWEALRGPAGVDRINFVRERLAGPRAKLAFTRQLQQAQERLKVAKEAQDRWEALRARSQRLTSMQRAQLLVPAEDVAARCAEVMERMPVLADVPVPDLAGASDPAATLARARRHVTQLVELARGRRREAEELGAALEEIDRLEAERQTVAVSEAEERVSHDRAVGALRDAEGARELAVAAFEAAVATEARVAQELALLDRLGEAAERYEDATLRSRALAQLRLELDASRALSRARATAEADRHASVTRRVRRRTELAERVAVLRSALATLREIDTRRDELARKLDGQPAEAVLAIQEQRLSVARGRAAELRAEVAAAEAELRQLDERLDALSALMERARELLSHDDVDCPLCGTGFDHGELLRRALAGAPRRAGAAEHAGVRAAKAAGELSAVDESLRVLDGEIRTLTALDQELTVLERRRRAVIAELATRWPDRAPTTDQGVSALLAECSDELARAELGLAGDPDLEASANAERAARADSQQFDERIDALESEMGELRSVQEQSGAVLAQFADTWSEGAGVSAAAKERRARLPGDLADLAADRKRLEDAKQRALDAVEDAMNRLTRAGLALERSAARAAALGTEVGERRSTWCTIAGAGEATPATLERLTNERERDLRSSVEAAEDLERLAAGYADWMADDERQRAEAERQRWFDALDAVTDDDVTARLARTAEAADEDASRIAETRARAYALADRLQVAADQFARSVLEPLSGTIDGFARALMTRADGSFFYRAQHQRNRTELITRVRVERRGGDAAQAEQVEIDPNLFLSEGQISALSMSSLLAASTSFQWSRWPALLMDDPLQHNDVIHAAAFVDLLRQLVRELGYQVILSTHDSDEAAFIARKCAHEHVPFTLCELKTASGGVFADVK